jgi:hypothetical protein
MPLWSTFATISGSAAGALIGLLFVAVSIRIDVVAGSTELLSRAAQTLVLFVTALFIAILLAIPHQSDVALGVELVVLAALTGTALIALDHRAKAHPGGDRISNVVHRVQPNATTSALLLVAGSLLIASVNAGVYVLVACVLTATGGGVISAWLFLTKIVPEP